MRNVLQTKSHEKPVNIDVCRCDVSKGETLAVWRKKDHDQPVTITGEMGEKDGRRFYAAKETSTGIAEDELEFVDTKVKDGYGSSTSTRLTRIVYGKPKSCRDGCAS